MELNDVAFAVGSGLDLSKDGNIILTSQFKLPKRSISGESGQNYFTARASGKDLEVSVIPVPI
ncbi:hypothetical protein GCM10008018_08850 [Paenibacillus marchantiophytorum]|uniref:Uncharacterized protein n=1 Tax=Paenibacillus marchantiophytorum TaxID=1619310 RepID=A0ABQ2BPV4_9BACL|nr:hypothetical protein GCM10008018_08850 [Paenibacillus marchantiophytorum]